MFGKFVRNNCLVLEFYGGNRTYEREEKSCFEEEIIHDLPSADTGNYMYDHHTF